VEEEVLILQRLILILILPPFRLTPNQKRENDHETSGSVELRASFRPRFELMNQFDYPAVKTGYVGKIIPVR
jgi:hypothetical protein